MDPTELSKLYVLLDTLSSAPAKSDRLLEIAKERATSDTYTDLVDTVGRIVDEVKAANPPLGRPSAFRAALVEAAERRSASTGGTERLAADVIRARLA